jgi:hypothetical protein
LKEDAPVAGAYSMVSDASGWYARLDRECSDRIEQLETWISSWEEATRHGIPIAATLPNFWPTLPAGLLSDPGAVLDHLLARYEAESDGRSPRGAYATPAKFAESILADELKNSRANTKKAPLPTLTLSALPPGFHAYAQQFNQNVSDELDEDCDDNCDGLQTRTGIPIPFADPSVGAGVFPARLFRIHTERSDKFTDEERKQDTLDLLNGLQLLDGSEVAVKCARHRLLIALCRCGLVDLDGDGDESKIGRKDAEIILKNAVQTGDALRGEWPWTEKPGLLVCRPPWLRIKDRFRGHPDGSNLRKELSRQLRNTAEKDGTRRFSTLRGNVNLYRLFLERGMQLVRDEGRVRMIVPDSLLREKSSIPLRKLMIESNQWTTSWSFPENQRVFPGVTQGVLVLSITTGGSTQTMKSFGPLEATEISTQSGLKTKAPFMELTRPSWTVWTRGTWAVPRMPRDPYERRRVIRAIEDLANKPRLSEDSNWLNPSGKPIRVRVGEIDQTNWSDDISEWALGARGVPFIRGTHFRTKGSEISINHPAYNSKINSESPERAHARWTGPIKPRGQPRLACQAIVNAQLERRLRWAVVPQDCVLGNSVNFLELPVEVLDKLAEKHGSVGKGLLWLAAHLNSEMLDLWSRAWAANNNVNNYEIESLPFPQPREIRSIST